MAQRPLIPLSISGARSDQRPSALMVLRMMTAIWMRRLISAPSPRRGGDHLHHIAPTQEQIDRTVIAIRFSVSETQRALRRMSGHR